MKIIPKVKSLEETKEFQKITNIVKIQLEQFQASTINSLAETLILRTIHERMRDFAYSEKIIAGTTISGINIISKKRFRVFFHSEYFGDNGFDVALAREKTGTTDHRIEPISLGSPFVEKPSALHWNGNKFSKGHDVSGVEPSHIIERTLDEISESFLESYSKLRRDWLKQQYGGLAEIAV